MNNSKGRAAKVGGAKAKSRGYSNKACSNRAGNKVTKGSSSNSETQDCK